MWLRLDTRFASHPKFTGWKPGEKWALVELFLYCAEYDNDGRVPDDFALLPRVVTPKLVAKAESSGWLDRRDDGLFVHDWAVYNPSPDALRAQRYRQRKAGGERDASVTTTAVDNGSDVTVERDGERDANVTLAHVGAGDARTSGRGRSSRPVPSRKSKSVSPAVEPSLRAGEAGPDGPTSGNGEEGGLADELSAQLDRLREGGDGDD